jgi:ketosteroid isomerase-like protein
MSFVLLICFHLALCLQLLATPTSPQPTLQPVQPSSSLTGVYRIDIPASDRLYSVVAGASSNLPFGEQQRFFIDLAVRLTPPDLLAIEVRNRQVSLGSSRAPRMTFVADGAMHNTRAPDGHVVHVRLALDDRRGNQRLIFTSSGRTEDNFSVEFETIEDGKRLRVVRRIAAEGLDQPLVIRTVYNKISDVARWELYGEAQVASGANSPANPNPSTARTTVTSTEPGMATGPTTVGALREALNEWIAATNNRDIERQMTFYAPRLKRFYLMSDAGRSFVREEKARVFASARVIDIRADEPEIILQDGGRTAVMRYRKKYRIENGRQSRRGEVIQELRWQSTANGWRIFSERDIRVLR